MKFGTTICCMDGRIQLPVLNYLEKRFGTPNIDNITEAGPNLVLHLGEDKPKLDAMLIKLNVSIKMHGSTQVAVVGHPDCARNPASKEEQIKHLCSAVNFVKSHFPDVEVIALWVEGNKEVEEISFE
ncbi:MAG: hypothetical protein D6830_07385 [Ignavibacteria bacterium]|nr:MAG: hypothetical protein D6830_07385 [Ignavibacteria bacterium]